jgi:hypothetical protein
VTFGGRSRLPNLQLLVGHRNISKNDTPIKDWIDRLPSERRNSFFAENFFPPGIGLEFNDFPKFYEARKKLLKEALRRVLAMAHATELDTSSSDESIDERLAEVDAEDLNEAGTL